jgi:hypothetical protein
MKSIGLATMTGALVGLCIVYWIGGLSNAAIALVLVICVATCNAIAPLFSRRKSQ